MREYYLYPTKTNSNITFIISPQGSLYDGLLPLYPPETNAEHFTTEHSGKLTVLSRILAKLSLSGERVVLVSNYTKVKLLSNI